MRQSYSAITALHMTVIVMGATGLFARTIDMPAWEITGIRTAVAALVLLVWVRLREGPFHFRFDQNFWRMSFLGVLLGAHWITYFHAMQVSSVAIGMIALFTYPIMTVFLEPLFNRIRLNWRDIASAMMVLVGVYFLVPEFSLDNPLTWGVIWGLVSALLFALRNILLNHWFKEQSAARTLGVQTAIVAVLLLPFVGAELAVEGLPGGTQLGLLLLLGVVFTAVAHSILGYTLRTLRPKTVALVSCMQPVYGVLYAALVLGSIPTLATVLGGCLIGFAAFYETLQVRH